MTTSHQYPIIIPPMVALTLDQLPEPYCIRTPDGPILYANLAFAKLIAVKAVHDIIDKFDYEISSRLMENEDTLAEWRMQDRNLITSCKPQSILELHPHAVDVPYICCKVPFYNNDHQCVAAFHSIKYLKIFTPNDFVKGRLPRSLLLHKPDDFFTEHECEIIFFRLQGISSKQIAEILGVAKRTVERRLAAMYAKAGVNHLDDFIAVCQRLNLHRYVPQRILAYKNRMKNSMRCNDLYLSPVNGEYNDAFC